MIQLIVSYVCELSGTVAWLWSIWENWMCKRINSHMQQLTVTLPYVDSYFVWFNQCIQI